ncbi:transposase [Candidatus Poribacteria bacterium]|nr:transposase [Candidatus Poribacteria bacterium]
MSILRFNYGNVNDEYEYKDKQLGFIDSCLDEDQIRQHFAATYIGCQTNQGRKPLDPVIPYKAHLLYFLKREIVSFNELPKQVEDKPDYRAFCRSDGITFTSGYLSLFRKEHLTPQMAAQLHEDILNALELESNTLSMRIGMWDSVPMPSYSSPYKDTKHCDCEEPCNCPKHFSDRDATIGWQSPTPTRKDKFLGYRKHTVLLYDQDKNQRLPIATNAQPANKPDIEIIEELLKACKGKLDILLVDQAIYDFQQILDWHEDYHILVLVKPKKNAVLPEYPISDTGTPCCPQMEKPLEWSHVDWDDEVHIYHCTELNCFYRHECPCQFEIPMEKHPALLGAFPAHTRCGRLLLSLRRLIEPEFGMQTLWSKLKNLPFRRLLNFRLLAQLVDTATLLRKVAQKFT